ncbi:hypothetical protein SAMN05880593_108234, partial [Rhizobium sp. RU36D]
SASTKLNWPSRRTDIKSPQIAANQLNHISRILQQSLKGGDRIAAPYLPHSGWWFSLDFVAVQISTFRDISVASKASAGDGSISPLEGEMGGSPEGGTRRQHPIRRGLVSARAAPSHTKNYVGYWRKCRFPVCRRGGACQAQNPPNHPDGLSRPVFTAIPACAMASPTCFDIPRNPDLTAKVFSWRKPGRQKDI